MEPCGRKVEGSDKLVWLDRNVSNTMLDRYMSMNIKEKLTSVHEVKALRRRELV